MTLQILKSFGITILNSEYNLFKIPGNQKYKPQTYTVEGDWSGGAFLLVAGAINGNITVQGLSMNSKQSDIAIIKALELAGAKMKLNENNIDIAKSDLQAFDFDATQSPDLFPPLVALASFCSGTSTIKGVSRLVFKESNRGKTLMDEFAKMNISLTIKGDLMSIQGGKVKAARIESHEDHRIAMALAITSLGSDGRVYIHDYQCVAKSYPGFFDDMRSLGAIIHE